MNAISTIFGIGLGVPFSQSISPPDLLKIIRFAAGSFRRQSVAFFGNGEDSRRLYEAIAAMIPDIRTHFIDLWCFFHDNVVMRPNGPEHRIFDDEFSSAVLLTRPTDYLFALRAIKHLFRTPMPVALPFWQQGDAAPQAISLGRRNPIVVNLYPFAGSNRFGPVLKALLDHLKYGHDTKTNHNMALTERVAAQLSNDVLEFGETACHDCQALVDARVSGAIEILDYYRDFFFHTHISAGQIASRPDTRFIHLIRDPRDILNSLYHYVVRCGVRDDFAPIRGMDKDAALRKMMEGFVYVNRSRTFFMLVPPLKEIATTFVDISRMTHVSLVRFEDIRMDPVPAYRRLLASIGADQPPLLAIDEDTLKSYIHLGTFEHQSGGARKDGDNVDSLTGRMRKGAVGDWRHHFSRRLAEDVEDLIGDDLDALGYAR